MAKKQKTGKNRKDKFYNIAKEVGYRARSAFKLVQLNRKFQFLQNSRVLIDLCAAPGGWLQVAKQHMPVESVICGVDLVPIKPITGVTTFTEDITTDSCKSKLRAHLKDWKADVVLNDGAPNVGKNWHLDSFSQAEITLMAAKLAAFFLRPGGWFITKVFRSADYTGIIWVLKQLFKKVHATKPSASRNESAEIFVVCQGFLAPSKIDPKFFDIKSALQQVDTDQKRVAFRDFESQKKRTAVGYDDANTNKGLLFNHASEIEFFESEEPLDFLFNTGRIDVGEDSAEHELFVEEIRFSCQDTKVLDKKRIKQLLNWRLKMRLELGLDAEPEDGEEPELEDEDVDSDEEEEKLLEKQTLEAAKDELKELRRKKKIRGKSLRTLRDLISNSVKLDYCHDMELFDLKNVKGNTEVDDDEINEAADALVDSELESGDEEDLPTDFDHVKTFDVDDEVANNLIKPLEDRDDIKDRKSKQWFSQEGWFDGINETRELEDANLEAIFPKQANDESKNAPTEKAGSSKPAAKAGTSEKMEVDASTPVTHYDLLSKKELRKVKRYEGQMLYPHEQDSASDDDSSDEETDIDTDNEEEQRLQLKDMEERIGTWREQRADKDDKKKMKVEARKKEAFPLTPKELAIATEMVVSKKRKRDFEELMYDKNSFNDPEELPEWFTINEKRHRFRRLPEVDQNLISMYAEKQKASNTRTIKKVAEAKMRKHRKFAKKQDKVRKMAEGILSQDDVTEKEKQVQLKRIYAKAGLKKNEKEPITYVPIKQGGGRRVPRPAGVKGKFKIVDSRMKAEMRAKKGAERRAGKKPSGGQGLNSKHQKSGRR